MGRELALQAMQALLVGASPTTQEYRSLRDEGFAYLRGAWPSLQQVDAADTIDAAIERFIRSRSRQEPPQLNPEEALGYLMRSIKNAQIDKFRGSREAPSSLDLSAADDRSNESGVEMTTDGGIMSLLDRAATLQELRTVLANLIDRGDVAAARTIFVWLDVAADTGRAPSARQVAAVMGVTHPTVMRALARFKDELKAVRDSA